MYQQILKSETYWLSLGRSVRRVLNFQSDVWFVPKSTFLTKWLRYDYVGTPWCHEDNWAYMSVSDRPKAAFEMLHDTRQIPWDVRIGNGGVSLRSVRPMLQTLQTLDSMAQENEDVEDVLFVLSLIQLGYHIANLNSSAEFSLDIVCADVLLHQNLRCISWVL